MPDISVVADLPSLRAERLAEFEASAGEVRELGAVFGRGLGADEAEAAACAVELAGKFERVLRRWARARAALGADDVRTAAHLRQLDNNFRDARAPTEVAGKLHADTCERCHAAPGEGAPAYCPPCVEAMAAARSC
jgi:hypothetical protein